MFRITRLLNIARPHLFTTPSLFPSSTLFFRNIALFSQQPTHKILEIINDENLQTNLDKFAQQIKSLDNQLKQQVFDIIVQKIKEGQLEASIVQDQKIRDQFKKYPSQYFDVYHYRIQNSMQKLQQIMEYEQSTIPKILAKEISDCFMVCFEVLKQIQSKEAAFKEIQLLRTFAVYNYKYLSQLVEPAKSKQVINKSKESYRLVLSKLASALNRLQEEQSKLSKSLEHNLTQQQKKQSQDQLSAMKQSKQLLAEEYAEVVQEMIDNQQELQQELKQQRQQQRQTLRTKAPKNQQRQQIQFIFTPQIIALEPYIQRAVKNYQLTPNVYLQSEYLYKFKKMLIDLRNEKQVRELFNSRKNNKEKQMQLRQLEKDLKSKLEALYEEGQNMLKDTSRHEKVSETEITSFILSLLQTKSYKFLAEDEQDGQMFNQKLVGQCVQKLVSHIDNQQMRKKVLALVVRQIKEELGIRIDSYVQKIPRNSRTQRRSRNQSEIDM